MNNIYFQLLDIKTDDFPMVLATVTKSVGSTPQKPGSSALFNRNGLLTGTVGGGVLEGEVQKIALNAIQTKKSGLYNFKLDTEIHQVQEVPVAQVNNHFILFKDKVFYKNRKKLSK